MILNIQYQNLVLIKLEILKIKDAYPYEWVDSYEKVTYSSLPPKEYFYSSLRDSKTDRSDGHISDEQYLHLKNVWDTFNFNRFEDFHHHYLKKMYYYWLMYFKSLFPPV